MSANKNENLGWCLIPPSVIVRTDLSANEKLLFGRIMGLVGSRGYCFASNEWLGDQMGIKKHSVSIIVSKLSTKGLVNVEVIRENGRVVERRIFVATPAPSLRQTYVTDMTYPSLMTETDIHISSKDKRVEKSNTGFEEFWTLFPKKIAKPIALRSWNKINPDNELKEKILVAVKKNCNTEQWRKDGGKFIPYPATWLNQERYNDEVVEQKKHKLIKI